MDTFDITSIDDYAKEHNLQKISMIKMDIEGAEMEALTGAVNTLRYMQPKLAISTYHKPEDIWEIPLFIKEQNSNYRLFFGHHTPMQEEAVYYAMI
ncbi:hypothetical protein TI04_07395 [Achromatium sp. WMS2]|nr:hypothetical protein TI04_07395 [Achromatium sp. WMS2]